MARSALVILGIGAVLAIDCGRGPPSPPGIRADAELRQATDCGSLTRAVQDLASQQMRAILEAYRKDTGGIAVADSAPAAGAAAGAAPASYSTTNVQVQGVDEADFVKNDGTRIFTLARGALWAAHSWPPEDLLLAAHLDIEGYPQSMFLDGDRVAVLSQVWSQAAADGPATSYTCALFATCSFGFPTTKVTVVDVGDLSAPAVRGEIYLPGYANEARRVGSKVLVVLNDAVRWPTGIRYWPDPIGGWNRDRQSAISDLEDRNDAIIYRTPIESWFPQGRRKLSSGEIVNVGYSCSDFYLPDAPEQLGLATIATVDLDRLEAGAARTSIVGLVDQIHATPTTLYLASRHYWWWAEPGQRDFTYLHRFDISQPGRALYVASGGVEGHLGNQFSLDDRDGLLRVAATTATWPAQGARHWTFGNHISVLGLREEKGRQRLAMIGDSGPLEENETIFASRFAGDKAFVVTFRSVDPLVTVDLRDPAHPRKVAELTEPGFSTLLQPIDDGHIVALGIDLPDPDAQGYVDWNRRAVKLSLYDVTDLAHPRRTSQVLVGTSWGWTQALWDHHAFNWYPQRKLLGLPFSDWIVPQPGQRWYDSFVSDLRLFSVDPAAGITPLGALSMGDVYVKAGDGVWTYWYRPWVQRGVMATDGSGNDFVYAISDAGLRSAALRYLGAPLATVPFPGAATSVP
jgi:uncharacterized secreted protein with C-terminal beta-propeller domain